MSRPPSRADVAAMIDHTLLAPEASDRDVTALCAEAVELGVCAACVSTARVPAAARALAGSPVRLAAVVGFPSGAHLAAVKADEAARALADGATELDMVIDLGYAAVGDWAMVGEEIAAVRAVAPEPVVLKVIIESAVLSEAQIDAACAAAVQAGANFVKTSTGFHPAGGASEAAVARMAANVAGAGVGVKASGGIRTAAQALSMIAAGATRLGMSRSAQVLQELAS
ncbi:MAG TPA: deoxyribose-phosphate aldolase [Solirubrobacteraceae bacterium]|nr:deoxyribose-phosphate aldolase [Solirubrobacteraceae bacterium]